MIPLAPTNEKKEKIWARLSRDDCDFVIFLTRCNIHAVEACVSVFRRESMDEFECFVLKAVDILGSTDIEGVNSLLHIGRQIIHQIIVKLNKDGLLSVSTEGLFKVTTPGRKVLVEGVMRKLAKRRQIFHFIDGSNEFLRIKEHSRFVTDLRPHETAAGWTFDIESLQKCINETNDWKKQRQFSTDIHELIMPCEENVAVEDITRESALIVDKAQSVNCAILVKFNDNTPFELFGYPISPKGHLLTMDHLFSLRGEDIIVRVFPYVDKIPDDEEMLAAFLLLKQKYMLGSIDDAMVASNRTHTTIEVSDDNGINWARFYWENIQGNAFFDITSETTTTMNKLVIESKSSNQQMINHLFELNKSYLSENNLQDISTYRTWLSEKKNLTDESIGNLASLAWELGNYRLSYKIAELEDMVDAKV